MSRYVTLTCDFANLSATDVQACIGKEKAKQLYKEGSYWKTKFEVPKDLFKDTLATPARPKRAAFGLVIDGKRTSTEHLYDLSDCADYVGLGSLVIGMEEETPDPAPKISIRLGTESIDGNLDCPAILFRTVKRQQHPTPTKLNISFTTENGIKFFGGPPTESDRCAAGVGVGNPGETVETNTCDDDDEGITFQIQEMAL